VAQALREAEADPATATEPSEAPANETPAHAYTPVWDTQQMTLLRFRAHVQRPHGDFENRAVEARAYEADVALLHGVAADLQALAADGKRFPVSIQIEHSSLASNSRRSNLIQALAAIPPLARKALTLEIGAPLDGFWTLGLKAFLEVIRPQGIGVSARMQLEEPHTIATGGVLKSIAVDLSGLGRGEAASLRLLTAFGEAVRSQGYECAAYSLNSRALVLGAMGAGFRYVAGRAVHADVPALTTALRFEPLDLYADVRRTGVSP
jgi:hypothetical protein